MSKKNNINLKQAREQGKLDEFIKDHEKDASGDLDSVESTLANIAANKKPKRSLADVEAEKKRRN